MATSLASIDTSKDNLLQTVMELEPAILAFKANYGEMGDAAFDLKMRCASLEAINSDETRELANSLMREGATGKKEAEKLCAPIKGVTNKLWKSFCGLENELLDQFGSVRARLEPLALAYDRKIAAAKREEEARRAEIARREAEDAALAEASRLHSEGHTEAAEAVISRPVEAAPVFVAPQAKMSGEAKSTTWQVEVFDIMALCKAIVAGTVPPTAVEANMSFLKKEANNRKQFYNIPGTTAKEVEGLRIRGN